MRIVHEFCRHLKCRSAILPRPWTIRHKSPNNGFRGEKRCQSHWRNHLLCAFTSCKCVLTSFLSKKRHPCGFEHVGDPNDVFASRHKASLESVLSMVVSHQFGRQCSHACGTTCDNPIHPTMLFISLGRVLQVSTSLGTLM